MKMPVRTFAAIVAVAFFSIAAHAQVRQTKLYIDDGSGHFTILQGAAGGDTLTFPTGGGTLQTNGGPLTVSTETDTAKAVDTVGVTANTSAATIVSNGSTTDVPATVKAGANGQVLYLFNNLGTTHNVTLSGYTIADGKIGVFIYLSGGWRALAPNGTAVAVF